MKTRMLIILCFCFSLQAYSQVSVWDGTIDTHFGGGTGTQSEPYLIESASQFAYFAYRVNNGFGSGQGNITDTCTYYKLMIDIDLNRILWTPIGYYNSSADQYSFGGYFDGNGHYISNLNVNMAVKNESRLGLFGYCTSATITNLRIIGNSTISNSLGSSASTIYLGSIVGYGINVTIKNCHSNTNISSYYVAVSYCGGIIGQTFNNYTGTSIISECSNSGSISYDSGIYSSNNAYSGGIIGKMETGVGVRGANDYAVNIINCYNVGQITTNCSNNSYAGGIAGSSNSGIFTITNCYNSGKINAANNSSYSGTGGIIGPYTNYGQGTVTNSYYLVTSAYANGYGISRTDVFMKSAEFVLLLNNGFSFYKQDLFPNANSGYPIISNINYTDLDIFNIDNKQPFFIYTNATSSELHVKALINESINYCIIYNPNGQILIQKDLINEVSTINIESLSKGLYFLKILGEENTIIKFMKK